MSIRLRAGLLIALTLCSSGIEAAETRVRRLVATPAAFELRHVAIACDLTIDSREGGPDPTIDYRYRLRVLGRDATSSWDSGWLRATGLRGQGLSPRAVPIAVLVDTVSAQALSEIWIEVAVEVDGRVDVPTRFAFFRWADKKFRAFPEPPPWPDQQPLPLDGGAASLSSPVVIPVQQMLEVSIPSERRSRVPHISWAHLRAQYR